MKLTKEILERYLKGNCSDEEITFIHENIDKIKDQADVLFSEEEWIDADNLSEYPNAEEIRKRIVDHIEDPIRKHRIQKRRKMVTWSVAASVILLISSVFYFFGTDTKHPIEPEIVLHEKPTTDPSTNLYYINSGKDVMHITAADGSSISLYPQSEIKFPEHFHKKISRDFFLKGKAKFHVAKDKNKPFHVHSTGMTTTALGTVFIVDELASSITQVKLLKGSVEVKPTTSKKQQPIVHILMPNEEIEVDHKRSKVLHTVKLASSPTERGGYFRETAEKIIFKNLALEEVFLILEQNYAINIRYHENQVKQKFYTGAFKQSKNIYEEILDEIKYLHEIELEVY
jgi:transmembrane sensor